MHVNLFLLTQFWRTLINLNQQLLLSGNTEDHINRPLPLLIHRQCFVFVYFYLLHGLQYPWVNFMTGVSEIKLLALMKEK